MMESDAVRRELGSLLRRWDAEELDEASVRDEAERIEFAWDGWRVLDALPAALEPADLAALAGVIVSLADMHQFLITRADIPVLVATLELIDMDRPESARDQLRSYTAQIDLNKRARELRDQPFYAPGVISLLG